MLELLIAVFGRLHPVLNHLPIGLLVALLGLEIVAAAIASPLPRRVITGLVWITAVAAIFSAVSGLVLSSEIEYGGQVLERHRLLGLGVAGLCIVLAILHLWAREGIRETALKAYRVVLVVAVLLLFPAGHLGGTITHGAGFLTGPYRAVSTVRAAERLVAKPDAAPEYVRDVAPVFEARCSTCHGDSKRKGGLSLADPASILAGGKNGPVIVPGDAAASEVIRRLRLPPDDPDHMPPETKPQPTVAEVDLVANWIARGSLFPGEIAVAEDQENVANREAPVVEVSQPQKASPEALAALRAKLVHVEPVAKDSELLWIDFVAAARTIGDNEATELLEPVLDYVTDLSMSRSLISDETMKLVARMPRLTKLDLRGTNITDAGVAALAGHPSLVELVMPRTKLTDGAAQHLLRLPKLRRVYLWNSGVTIRGIAELRLGREDLVIEAGDAGEARALEVEGSLALTKPEQLRVGAAPPVNAACPVTGKPVDPAYSIVFRGRVIGFCCPKCPAAFWADPAAYEAKFK